MNCTKEEVPDWACIIFRDLIVLIISAKKYLPMLASSSTSIFWEGIPVGLEFLAFFPEGSARGGDLDLTDWVPTETK